MTTSRDKRQYSTRIVYCIYHDEQPHPLSRHVVPLIETVLRQTVTVQTDESVEQYFFFSIDLLHYTLNKDDSNFVSVCYQSEIYDSNQSSPALFFRGVIGVVNDTQCNRFKIIIKKVLKNVPFELLESRLMNSAHANEIN